RAAKVLAEATLTSDTAAARTHGVSTSSIATWRKRLDTDPELAGLYAEQLERAAGAWRDRLREVLTEGALPAPGLPARADPDPAARPLLPLSPRAPDRAHAAGPAYRRAAPDRRPRAPIR